LLVCLATAALLRRARFVRLAGLIALAFFLALLAGLLATRLLATLLIRANLILARLLVAWSILLLLAAIGIVTLLLLAFIRIVTVVRHTQSLLVSGAVDFSMKEIFYVSLHRCCALHRA
jgi:hypothetical protein